MRGRIRAGIDTIRGCRIESIYELPPLEETRKPLTGQNETAGDSATAEAGEQETQ